MRHYILPAVVLLVALTAPAGEAEQTGDEAKAKAAFEAAYDAGTAAAIKKDWSAAEKQFDAAIKALGDLPHAKKAVAQVLLAKARDMAKQEGALVAAAELLRLKQWTEAEAAYRRAAVLLGETDAIREGIAAAQAGAKAEKETAGKKAATPPSPPPVVPPLPPPAPETKPATPASTAPPPPPPALGIPTPAGLDREEWLKGAGSSCYWEGERLHLEEGDEYLKKILTKDFAASIAIEAQMDHRSRICIELRPVKDSGSKAKIVGWGSKEGSPPMLALDKETVASGDARPPQEQVTLSFVRTGSKIEFYCNGKLLGHTFDAKAGQPYYLWVSGKGIMNGAKVVER
ncbi:MAG: hypothetical protein NTW87_28635 [Planctomycetota bacterium]|nr:hypothetical protein [Planctomycetota bacterium]